MNALAFVPARQPFGSFFSFFDVAAADDDVVGPTAWIIRAVPNSTYFCHFFRPSRRSARSPT